MMSLGALGFLQPWMLAALAGLPLIWWLLRFTPPRPNQVAFPPTRLLRGLEKTEETPQHSPWWLTALRVLLAALVILALARPVIHPDREAVTGTGPVVLLIDNGWQSASRWSEREDLIGALIARAERDGRPVFIAGTADTDHRNLVPLGPEKAREAAAGLKPLPHSPNRAKLATELTDALKDAKSPTIYWLSDNLDHGAASRFAEQLKTAAGDDGAVVLVNAKDDLGALGLHASLDEKGDLKAHLVRAGGAAQAGRVFALSARSERLGEASFAFDTDGRKTTAAFDLPLEIRNQVTQLIVSGEESTGAVHLLDGRSRWRRVGIISGESRELSQPLLSPLYYVERALKPYAEVISTEDRNIAAAVQELLKRNLSLMVLADIGKIVGGTEKEIESWVQRGGTLIRFAGPRLELGGDRLLPVQLRQGGRTLGGSLSWSTPQPLAPFEENSPFYGLDTPSEVVVNRQVLADPTSLGSSEIWARLKDGTPLVSSARRGKGRLVLFHITANSDWSKLPLSGLFVEMLRRITERSTTVSAEGNRTSEAAADERPEQTNQGILAPLQLLDGYGQLGAPSASVAPLSAATFDTIRAGAQHPPGYYGSAGNTRALNAVTDKTTLSPLPSLPTGIARIGYGLEHALRLKPWLLAAAVIIFLIDMLAVLFLSLGSRFLGRAGTTAAIAAAMLTGSAALTPDARAQDTAKPGLDFALKAALETRLAYVITGDDQLDRASRQGLSGLGKVLRARTAIEPAEPIGVDVAKDELAFFPLIYWPVRPDATTLPDSTLSKIDAFMKQGGMIVFDTRDYQTSVPTGTGNAQGPGATALSRLLGKLDVPPLQPVPENHVMTKSFYLLNNFPGRWDGGTLWVEAEPQSEEVRSERSRRSDGVSSMLITSNDFAAAWALDDNNQPLYPVVPGGEVQREMAYRVGVNIVMYALTGNYKADQVHVPALLERLGQ